LFGMFAPDRSAAGGRTAAENREADFVFYCLEADPWDIPTMTQFSSGMEEASGTRAAHALALRIPPIREGREAAVGHIEEGLAAGVDGFIFPHVENADEVAVAIDTLGNRVWPVHPEGDVFSLVQIEDRSGVQRVREIVSAPGVGVVLPGTGDLKQAFGGDMRAVENAIQTVLATCKEFDVPCGVTAGVRDIADRLEQGFRMIIATELEALGVGRAAVERRD